MGPTLVSPDTGRRLLNAIRRLEGETDSPLGDDRSRKTGAVWAFVKPTGNGSAINGYPGVVLLPTASLNLFDSDANSEPIWIYSADRVTNLAVGFPTIARLSGWDDAKQLSTWQAMPVDQGECCPGPLTSALGATDCCDALGNPGGPQGCDPPGFPRCAAVVIRDYMGNTTTVILGRPPTDTTTVGVQWQTAADSGTVSVWNVFDDNSQTSGGGDYSGGFQFGDITPGSGMAGLGFSAGCGTYLVITGRTGYSQGRALNSSQLQNGWPPLMQPYGINPPSLVSVTSLDPSQCGLSGAGGGLGTGTGGTGGGGAGGGGTFCQPCDPATDYPCYNCQNGQFCANWEACFGTGGGGGGILGPQKAASGCAGCGGGAVTASTSAAASVPAGADCACHGESAILGLADELAAPLGSAKPIDDYLMSQIDASTASGVGPNARISKTADTSRSSNTTLTADPDLQFSMAANWSGVIEIWALYDPGTTGIGSADFKWDLNGPAGANYITAYIVQNAAGNSAPATVGPDTAYNQTHTLGTGGSQLGGLVHVNVYVNNGGTAGTFSFRWAQNTSNGTATKVLKGSYLEYRNP